MALRLDETMIVSSEIALIDRDGDNSFFVILKNGYRKTFEYKTSSIRDKKMAWLEESLDIELKSSEQLEIRKVEALENEANFSEKQAKALERQNWLTENKPPKNGCCNC